MSKDSIPLIAPDIGRFARNLAVQLNDNKELPSHLSLMNMLARASGFRNYQHLRAAQASKDRLDQPVDLVVDFRLVERAMHQFNAQGQLIRWPSKRSVQTLCLWALWAQLPSATLMHERDVNGTLNAWHLFQDPALVRRSLISQKMLCWASGFCLPLSLQGLQH